MIVSSKVNINIYIYENNKSYFIKYFSYQTIELNKNIKFAFTTNS